MFSLPMLRDGTFPCPWSMHTHVSGGKIERKANALHRCYFFFVQFVRNTPRLGIWLLILSRDDLLGLYWHYLYNFSIKYFPRMFSILIFLNHKIEQFFFLSNATTCPCGLRGTPFWAWQECNRLLRLGRPWGAVTLYRWCEWWNRRM